MRAAVVYFPAGNRDRIAKVSKALAKGIESQGHQVDIVDASTEVNSKLSVYQYVAIGVQFPKFFSGKLPEPVRRYLKNAGMIAGKRCFAFIMPRPILAARSLSNLMASMESEGMYLKFSDILGDETLAQEIGKKLLLD